MKKLLVLSFGAFVAQTTEYLPIGLLPQISHDLHISSGSVGSLVTGYAWIAAASAIPLTHLTSRFDRRLLYTALLATITAANVLACFSHSYFSLLIARVATGLTHGVFWSMLAVLATRLAPELSASKATAWVYSGISLSIVLGVPLAAEVGGRLGWRAAFALFALLGVVALALAAFSLPPIREDVSKATGDLPPVNLQLYAAALVTGLIVTAQFCSYTYVVPLLRDLAAVPVEHLPVSLLVFGLAGVTGTFLVGSLKYRPRELVLLAASGIVASQMLMLSISTRGTWVWIQVALWGVSTSAVIVSLQSWILELRPNDRGRASAFYVAAFNLGIGAGAILGDWVLHSKGLHDVPLASILVGIVAVASFVFGHLARQFQTER